jgi:DDE family transposase
MVFSVQELIKNIRFAAMALPDARHGDNTRYSMEDILLSAFSVFFTQSPSFLSFQRAMQEQTGRNNAASLFTVQTVPSDNRIRTALDGISPEQLFPVFHMCFTALFPDNTIEQFKSTLGYLLALDGTGYFSSDTIHCKNCLTKIDTKTGKVTYYHSALTPVLVKPEENHVISLPPAFITPQDGDTKQDCENKAAKRWLWEQSEYGRRLLATGSEVTILGDDLYSRQPVMKTILAQKYHYLLVCKRESHPWLYDWVDHLDIGKNEDQKHTSTQRVWTGNFHKITTYHYANHVPLKDSKDSLWVNWVEVTVTKEEDGKLLYHNSFITNHQITEENLITVVEAGRARWKIENENNNVLKTKGYHFEHNYGHGEQTLSLVLLTLILLAFLFHTILDVSCAEYQKLCGILKRQFFFSGIRELTQYFYATSWEHLFAFMQAARTHQFILPTAPFATLPLSPP